MINELIGYKIALSCAITTVLAYFGIPQVGITVLTTMMILDIITGILKVKKLDGGDAVTSNGIAKGLRLKMLNMTLIFAVGLGLKYLGMPGNITLDACIAILISAELYSIIQNVYSSHTGRRLSEYNAFVIFLEKLAGLLKSKHQDNGKK